MKMPSIDMVDSMRRMTFHVKIKRTREMHLRMWLGTKLIMLAAIVMNCRVEIETQT